MKKREGGDKNISMIFLSFLLVLGLIFVYFFSLSSINSFDFHGSVTGKVVGCVPENWLCVPSYYGDGDCDCGCGIPDIDCVNGGCTYTGCYDPECEYCFAENTGHSIGCPDGPTPEPGHDF